jgi:hexokinase
MCSGAYLGTAISIALRHAAADGLFKRSAITKAMSNITLTLKDVDDYLYGPYRTDTVIGKIFEHAALAGVAYGTLDDANWITGIREASVPGGARLAASLIAAAVIKSGEGADPTRPVCVLAEGTTFSRSWKLRARCEAYLAEALWRRRGLTAEVVTVDNAVTLGAAVAGLTS